MIQGKMVVASIWKEDVTLLPRVFETLGVLGQVELESIRNQLAVLIYNPFENHTVEQSSFWLVLSRVSRKFIHRNKMLYLPIDILI